MNLLSETKPQICSNFFFNKTYIMYSGILMSSDCCDFFTGILSLNMYYLKKRILNTGVPEMHGKILTTSYWLHVELGKNTPTRSNLYEICFKTREPHWCTFYKI
jgi:hypothetical protein